MGVEIERKFLLASGNWRESVADSQRMAQGYLTSAAAIERGLDHCSVRVRIAGDDARINIKSAQLGVERLEFEYPVPLEDAEVMMERLCAGCVEKVRHHVLVDGWMFEIDEFLGANAGLCVAEIELPEVDAAFPRPAWLGREVSQLSRYYNVCLIDHPFRDWSDAERAGEDAGAC